MLVKKKTFLLPQGLINKVKKTFHARTETEAIIRAMEEVSFRNELLSWDQKHCGKLKIQDVYGR